MLNWCCLKKIFKKVSKKQKEVQDVHACFC